MHRTSRILLLLALMAGAGGDVAVAEMHVRVDSDRIQIGPTEFVPRYLDLPRVLSVPAGQVRTLPPDSTWDYIEVSGTLRVSRDADTIVRFTHLFVLPGGVLDVGTAQDPVQRKVEFIIRDVPIDTARDPFQWGNGLLNFGRQTRVGQRKTAFVELAADADAGATVLRVTETPEGWKPGDELLLPDTRQVGWHDQTLDTARRETVTIAAVNGTVVTLAQPLGFGRASIRTPDGELVLRPRVANLDRNIVIRSENPNGVRGHTANVGHGATWDVQYNAFAGLGRSRAERTDNTAPDRSRIGTNQLGRYIDHSHHVGDASGSRSIGNSYRDDGRAKWGVVLHQTDEVLVENNVCVGVRGSCFVTEDGNEARNVFRRNFAAYVIGKDGPTMVGQTQVDFNEICPGCEGSAFWFHGVNQTIDGNEAWNNEVGINIVLRAFGSTAAPMQLPAPMTLPVLVRGNVTASNYAAGLEFWGIQRFPTDDHIAAHNGMNQVNIPGPPGSNVYLRNLTAVASGARSVCIEGGGGYVPAMEVVNSRLLGCAIGTSDNGISIEFATFRNVVMQNRVNFTTAYHPYAVTFENVMHKPLGNFPPQYIVFGENSNVWSPGQIIPGGAMYAWNTQRGSQHKIINWQGTGKNYVLMLPGQQSSAAAWPSVDPIGYLDLVPETGLTMREAWNKYGLALRGDLYDDAEAIRLEGLVNGVAREGLEAPLGPPRTVLTSPNMISSPRIEGGGVKLVFVLTGRRDIADTVACYKVNDGRARCVRPDFQDVATTSVPLSDLPTGHQTVTTWRQTAAGVKVPTSDMTFQFSTSAPATATTSTAK